MPSQTAMTLNNGSSVAKTFTPEGVFRPNTTSPYRAEWADRSGGPALRYPSIVQTENEVKGTNSDELVQKRWIITIPYQVTLPSGAVVFKTASVGVDARCLPDCPLSIRKDLAAFVEGFTASSYFQGKVESDEKTYT
jgi:hypothetical protein